MIRHALMLSALLTLPLLDAVAAQSNATADEGAWLTEAQENLQATYQNLQFDKIAASDLPGFIEIYTGGKILYYQPDKELLVIGEVYAANGVSLTEQKTAAFAAERAGAIDRSVALVVGTGAREVIAFVDPDCTYCRQARAWFREQQFPDVKELLYFMPLKGRAQAEARALAALCAGPAEQPAALTRTFDTSLRVDLTQSVRCPEGLQQLARQAEMARQVGVYATPFFIIDGEVVAGFDKTRLTALLGAPRTAPQVPLSAR